MVPSPRLPSGPGPTGGGSDPGSPRVSRADHLLSIPLGRLFDPDPDPTREYPGLTADIEGFVTAPGATITIAATAPGPQGADLLDSAWSVLRRKGIGIRHLTVMNDRGRLVSLMTLRIDGAGELGRLLDAALVVPVRAHNGIAEVHLLATPGEIAAIEARVRPDRTSPPEPSLDPPPAALPPALKPGDWAFLGLLSSVGAFDGSDPPSPQLIADALGIEPRAFAERARAIEGGLAELVTDLFGTPASDGLRESAA